jgi:hypothetical protein
MAKKKSNILTVTLEQQKQQSVHCALKHLRDRGWRVAVHNDYMLHNKLHTFWLFTASHGPYFAKGESTEDFYALNQVLQQVDDIEAWSRPKRKEVHP